ncbi:hypothetical protein M441DRAFT_338113 [Trichoderma asperellum CBS 433.97]|uniref:Secreted protein n=1 Tax=Trichoderma asperellum (strain ATCC 204424 / CBS 433.97 / NBRC 101777) TaxID=1042311 RepID=A0A2T3ZGP0_TRIA4|nr:hypothetical protein M441DRAFT_338113 [Trichoderma asperellum CBS 433.97]PTB43963.1 hypothetical protein M441DRAFT_338113 [Trichoderma asperellum CBS 433.97]
MLCACLLSDTVPLILSTPCLLGTAAIEFAIPCTQLEPYCFSSKYVGLCSIVRSLDKTSFCSLPCSETVTRGSPTDSPQGAHINATTALISCRSRHTLRIPSPSPWLQDDASRDSARTLPAANACKWRP